tara:strand:- start:15592 stop:16083 length:492 start_codon:yes stop_codon:yes gene_type:complete
MADLNWITLIFGTFLFAVLLVISKIDFKELKIPDGLNLVLALSGIAYQWVTKIEFPIVPLAGGVLLFFCFYAVRSIHHRMRGIVGLGLGDVKMAGAAAVWLHPANLPVFVFLSSAAALISMRLFNRRDFRFQTTGQTPFGPFLAIGLFVSWCLETFTTIGLLA